MNEIELTRGDTLYLEIHIEDDEGNDYIPTQKDSLVFTVKKNVYQNEPLIQKNVYNGVLTIEHSDTQQLPYGEYVYDVQLTQANGDVTTVIKPSKFVIDYEVNYD